MTKSTEPKSNTQNHKAHLIKLIHIAKTQLHMGDDEYRLLLANLSGGKTSSKQLSLAQLNAVMKQMKSMGFVVMVKQDTTPKSIYDAHDDIKGQVKLIRHLWLTLYDLGVVKNNSEMALAKYVKRITGTDHYNWLSCKQASHVIETLKKWHDRETDQRKNYDDKNPREST